MVNRSSKDHKYEKLWGFENESQLADFTQTVFKEKDVWDIFYDLKSKPTTTL